MEFIDFLRKGVPLSLQQNSSQGFDKIGTGTTKSLPFWESQTPLGPVSPRKHAQEEKSSSCGKSSLLMLCHCIILSPLPSNILIGISNF